MGDAKFCPNCGHSMVNSGNSVKNTKYCTNCASEIDVNAVICPNCGVRVANLEEKSVGVAALLSIIFPGLGHLYVGLNNKCLTFIIAYIVSAILCVIIIGIVLVIIVWIWALVDIIKSTEAINEGKDVEDKLF